MGFISFQRLPREDLWSNCFIAEWYVSGNVDGLPEPLREEVSSPKGARELASCLKCDTRTDRYAIYDAVD